MIWPMVRRESETMTCNVRVLRRRQGVAEWLGFGRFMHLLQESVETKREMAIFYKRQVTTMKPKTALRLRLLFLTLSSVGLLLGQAALPDGIQKFSTVEGITEYRLTNGMRLLLFPDASSPKLTVNITYLVGSKHENYGETGMAHLLEHMVFKPTKNRGNIIKEMTDHGAQFNGTTWLDRTNYYETVNASDENLQWAIELEADRMVNALIAKSDLDKEMTVVRNEFEAGENSPMRVLMQRTQAAAYEWHNYGKTTIGSRADIENVPIERLQGFYRKYYQPDNAVLVIAGKFDAPKALRLVAKNFGAIARPERKLDKIWTTEPTQDGERTVTVRRVGDVQMLLAAYHIPSGIHPDSEALEVLSSVLSNNPSGRLYKGMVESKKAAGVFGFGLQGADAGLLMFGSQLRKDQSLAEAKSAMFATLEGVVKEPPSKEEVDRAKANLSKQIELMMTNSQQIAISLSELASMADWRMLFVSRDRLQKVTPEDVQRVAKAYLKDDNRTVGSFIPVDKPDRSEIPPPPDFTDLVTNYKGRAAMAEGEVFDPSPANIDSRTKRATLPNGMKLVMMPKKNRGNTVYGRITLRVGDEKSLFGLSESASLAWSMLMRGTKNKTRQQIQDEADKLKLRLNIGGSAATGAANVETTRENLAGALSLAVEVLRQPSFDDREFDTLKQSILASYEANLREPQALAGVMLSKHLRPYAKGDIRAVKSYEESIEAIKATKLEDLKNFHTQFFGGTSGGVITLVGDFDPTAVEAQLRGLLGDWKSPKGYVKTTSPYQKVEAVNRTINTPDKANAMFMAGMNIALSDEDPGYPAITFANYLFGQNADSRLFNRLRQKEGWSYGAGSSLGAGTKENGGAMQVYAILAPENLAKLENGVKEEFNKILTEGFSADEVAKGKKSWLQSQQVQRTQDQSLLGMLSGFEFYGRRMDWAAQLEAKVAALTTEEVNAAVKKYIDLNALSIFKAGDMKKAGLPQ